VLRDFPTRKTMGELGPTTQGLGVRLVLERQSARGELDLGEDGKFFPSDAAIARWKEGSHGKATVVYE
jgi:DNA polymerase-3 subunit alpha